MGATVLGLPEFRRGEELWSMRSPVPTFTSGVPVFSGVFQMFEKQRLKFTTLAHLLLPSLRLTLTGTAKKSLKLRFSPAPPPHSQAPPSPLLLITINYFFSPVYFKQTQYF